MNSKTVCQQDFEFDLYNDLDVVIEGKIQVKGYEPGDPGNICYPPTGSQFEETTTILVVNGHEIKIDNETAWQIFKALECRIDNKIEDIRQQITASFQEGGAAEYFMQKRFM